MCENMQSHWQSDWFAVSVLLALCLCLVSVQPLTAQESSSPSQMTTTELSNLLVSRLEARKIQAEKQVSYWTSIIESLTNEKEKDKQSLIESSALREKAESELKKSQADLMAISISLESLRTDFDKYKNEATGQIRQLERSIRLHKAVNVTLSIGIVAGGTYLLGDKLGWW